MIVCLGTTPVFQRSMVFDRVTPDDVNRATAVYDYASGKSPNVARVLHTLGEDPVVTGFAGGDRGRALAADLDRIGVRHDFVWVEAPTRQCVTVIDRATGTATELVEESAPVRPEDWDALDQKLAQLIPDALACVFSGSLPPGAPKEFYYTCLNAFCPPDMPVILDARRQALRRATRSTRQHVIPKLNHGEFIETWGPSATSEEGLRELLRFLPPVMGCAVVTQGARGAIAVDSERERAWRVLPPAVLARSAVGSGDAFAAGMIFEIVRGKGVEDACALGAACGAANAMTDLAGHLSAQDVESLRSQVRIEPFQMEFI
jgi:tagatose 6-phosphate kinase